MSTLDLDALADLVPRPDEEARERAQERQRALVKPPGSLGRLEDLSLWLAAVQGACPTRPLTRPRAVVFAGDHGVAELGVSAYPPQTTAALLRATLDGGTAAAVLARETGVTVRLVDVAVADPLADVPADVTRHKVHQGSGRIDVADALTVPEAEQAFRVGMTVADEEVDSGADLLVLGHLGVGGSTPAAVLAGALLGLDAATVTGRGSGVDDNRWMRKCATVRDALRRARRVVSDPLRLLATSGGADFAAMAGFLVQAAVRRTPVLLDGLAPAVSALVAQRIAYGAVDWWLAGQLSPEPAHAKALDRLGLEPLLAYRIGLGQGAGALLAVPLLRAAAVLLAEMATYEEAGVPPGSPWPRG
ncbi:nicotinate-nucleotide--dimethylbenzimidazole phosphoribosyltransferase [Carbonactinospora thermoautotrophica]|uniref:nicotinate-nucleotide--dimethylbenzimidazole phosphoribosyltransferase n=1 Tax=Carbonactinospora thermoautotrophica TaxID=1469144 RepID=UPI0022714B5E|nr:nicotinate-nucleotide--dimethylbenzimidazole phosphoribosyltransferase [Carbonactinospora thermoautotrophica]MCX9190870.1 nicotinate-nucleotide--dimethylbenzimidazole phosphoribosyltransferase [Carbonactinospora thermoautotrophica]